MIFPAPLVAIATALRSGQLDLLDYIDETCNRIETSDSLVHALLPEPERRARLKKDAAALQARFSRAADRPSLYGVLIGVKDTFRVDGFPTQAGSQLSPELFTGPEAPCISMLRAAGALILGKTVTTEFAYFEPGPTHNPHNLAHTPGGSSSGSVAAVAAGYCPLALGTQVIGSTIRPAAYCGIVGFKPSYGRISTEGLIKCAASVEHVGYFAQDVPGIAFAAPLLCSEWHEVKVETLPILGVPEGPYLAQASEEAIAAFEEQLALLQKAGYTVRRVKTLSNIEEINRSHTRMVFAEMAQVHHTWFAQYESLYRPRTAAALREGQTVTKEEHAAARAGRAMLRDELELGMRQNSINLWVCPATTGPAPEGLESTGSPLMNLPWTYTGLPAITVPAGRAANGLPQGFQCVGAMMSDEYLLACAASIAKILAH